MLTEPEASDATSWNFGEPVSLDCGVPDNVRLLLSTPSHGGALESEYFVLESLLAKVSSAKMKLKGRATRATGGNCALMG